jgi:alginate O-acetyltransferase complex protein AlgI
MLFCTSQFLYFFLAVFAVYWLLPWPRARVWLLVAASFYFYATWSRPLALLVGVFTFLDYLAGRAIEASQGRRRKLLFLLGLTLNVGLLGYFKYADFFLSSLQQALDAAGTPVSLPVLKLLAPIGLSFYTFEAINYLTDVYRGRLQAERNVANFFLFILFFPHLVAGPIVQARDFLPQVRRPKRWDWLRLGLGLLLFLLGFVKKVVIADRMALFADPVFRDPHLYGTGTLWLATLAYALQVYGDFSGYSDMALGAAHMLGYKLTPNFNLPYLAANIGEFWRRWHISLSTWLRNHIFIPLGGSRGGRWLTARNLLLTMALGGLWHGASWAYVVWGVLHGLMLIGHRVFVSLCEGRRGVTQVLQSRLGTVGRVGFTFLCFCLTLVVFRCSTLATGATMLGRMLRSCAGQDGPLHSRAVWVTVLAVALGHAFALSVGWRMWVLRLPAPVRGLGYATALSVALILAPGQGKAFIYFQF